MTTKIEARHQRCPSECRPVRASVIEERVLGNRVTRRLCCDTCRLRWTQHRYV